GAWPGGPLAAATLGGRWFSRWYSLARQHEVSGRPLSFAAARIFRAAGGDFARAADQLAERDRHAANSRGRGPLRSGRPGRPGRRGRAVRAFPGHGPCDPEYGSGDYKGFGRSAPGRGVGRAGVAAVVGRGRLALAARPRRLPLVSDHAVVSTANTG